MIIFKTKQRKLFFLSVISFLVLNYYFNNKHKNCSSTVKIRYNENYEWTLNNNLIQYSSYIIVDSTKNGIFRVEGYLHPNFKNIEPLNKVIFICILKNLVNEEIISLETADNPAYPDRDPKYRNKKFIFKFKKEHFHDQNNIDINKIVIAIIRKNDFDSLLNENIISNLIDDDNSTNGPVVLPYSMLNFQKPTVIYTNEPRLPGVGLSVHYTYQLQNYTVAWVRSQFELGIAEMVLYDATENFELTKLLRENIPSEYKLTIRPYNLNENDVCDSKRLLKQHVGKSNVDKIGCIFNKKCKDFFLDEFKDRIEYFSRLKHEYMTQNDGFSQLGQKYEFYAQYDLDEYILPHRLNQSHDQFLKQNFTCDNLCKTETFNDYQNNFYKSINIYNYVKSLLSEYNGPNDKNRIRSVFFGQTLYITSDQVLNKLMSDIGKILLSDLNGKAEIKLYDAQDSNTVFTVSKKDFGYMRSLSAIYSNLFKCNYKRNYIDMGIHVQFQNFFYITDRHYGRWGKSIHISKLIKTIHTHFAYDYEPNTWILNANVNDGHLLSHFRYNLNEYFFHHKFMKPSSRSIGQLKVNVEYFMYILKKFQFCDVIN